MKAMRWEVQIGEQVHTVTVRFELTGGPGEVWYDDKLVESWEIRMASTRRYHVGAAAVVLSWTGGHSRS